MNFEGIQRILAYREPVDMRKSFPGLTAITKNVLREDPLSGTLFVFHNKRCDQIKMLLWDRTGFWVFAKKLECGRFKVPGKESKKELNLQTLQAILDGIRLGKRK